PSTATKALTLSVASAPVTLTITTSSLANATAGTAYSAALQASGGVTPYTWSISAGALPAGVSLNASTGAISGTPTASGSFNFTASVRDSATTPSTATKALTLSVASAPVTLTITTSSLANATAGTAYSAALQASGGVTPYTWSISAGALPAGVSLNASTGAISGTPTASGSFNPTFAARDSAPTPVTATKALSLTVAPANEYPVAKLSVTPTSGTVPLAVTASTAGSSDPDGTIASTSINFGDGTIVNAASGSHTYAAAGTYTVTATVTDNGGKSSSVTATVTVAPANQPPVAKLSVTPTSGTAPLAVTASTAGSSDPDGTIASTSINFGDGTVVNAASGSHTYPAAGTYTVTATVTDNGGKSGSVTASVKVNPVGSLDCNSTSFSFVNFSDDYMMGEGSGLDNGVLSRVYALDPNIRMAIGEGDLQNLQDARETVDAALSGKRPCGETEYPFFSTMGNHNYGSDDPTLSWWESTYGNNWSANAAGSRLALQLPGVSNFNRGPLQTSQRIPNAAVYSFDFKNAHLVFLDDFEKFSPSSTVSDDSQFGPSDANGATVDPTSSQLDWLSQDLAATTQPVKFVFTHVGIVAHSYTSACSAWSEHNSDFNTSALAKVLAANNVTAIYRGHDHCPSRALLDGNRTVVWERSWNDVNGGLKGDPSLWSGLIGAGKFWQVDDGSVYNDNGFYVITAVTPTSVTFSTYTFKSSAGNPVLWETFTIPLSGGGGGGGDTTLPTISLSSPSNGSTVSGNVTLSATASDNVGVVGVQFKVDGTNLGAEVTATPYSMSWNSTTASNGSHAISAVARDAAGNTNTASATVNVSNVSDTTPPTVSITAPANGATVSNTFTLSATASDNVAVAGIQFQVDGTNLGNEITSSPYSISVNSNSYPNGSHTFSATARDAANNSAVASILATISNQPPSGTTIYLDANISSASCTTYNASARNCTGGTATAYKTMASAGSAASAGTTILVRAGTFSQLAPAKSGTAAGPITWRVYSGETATINGGSPAIQLTNRQYLVVDGFTISNAESWLEGDNMQYVTLQNNRFNGGTGAFTASSFLNANYNKFLNNTFLNSSGDSLTMFSSDHNLIQGNTFTDADHTLFALKCGNYNVIRGNTFSNSRQKGEEVFDCTTSEPGVPVTELNSTKHNLIEGNSYVLTAANNGDGPFAGIQYAGQNGIIRRNIFYNTKGAGLDFTNYSGEADYDNYNRAYNNVFYNNIGGGSATTSGDQDNVLKNNIFYKNSPMPVPWNDNNPSGSQLSNYQSSGFRVERNDIFNNAAGESGVIQFNYTNLTLAQAQSQNPSLYANNLEVDPGFVNAAGHDFHLQPSSPMINAGTFLTTTSSAGSGASMQVADAGYFFDGFGIQAEVGDTIQLANSTSVAVVTAVNYTTNTLTLDRSLSWTQGQGVSLAYSGSAPDLGVYETN
ncbi:MAG: putative Ig domain-containing protein, partial [Acidobacteriia bacterium]|nr:putative Ig domain-containing protein [Terriglobia bacterium]